MAETGPMPQSSTPPSGTTPTPAPAMPEAQPVFDVSSQHVWMGRVETQKYVFLWCAFAFFLGSILSWRGASSQGGMTLLQALICVLSLSAIWGSIVVIRGRRALSTALFVVEFVALFSVVIHYNYVAKNAVATANMKYDEINAQRTKLKAELGGKAASMAELKALDAAWERVEYGQLWSVGDLFVAPVAMIRKPVDDIDRVRAETAWNSFGTGFFVTALASAFFVLYFIGVIVKAVAAGKKKDTPPPPTARPGRRPREADDAPKPGSKDAPKAGDTAKPPAL